MKAEISNENKAKFFAMYYDTVTMLEHENSAPVFVMGDHLKQAMNGYGNLKLNLKPLSSITDEDAIEVARVYNGRYSGHEYLDEKLCTNTVFYTKTSNSSYQIQKLHTGFNLDRGPAKIIDFLRSKGYAVPFMGLSVDEMVEAGWIVLKN